MIRRSIALMPALAVVFSLGTLLAQDAQSEAPRNDKLLTYSARFYCSQPQDRLLPGDCENCWDSEIALANYGRAEANVTIWVVEARPISQTAPPTRSEPSIELLLAPNDAVRIGCGSLAQLLPAEEMLGRAKRAQPNGFLRFESDQRVHAVATYVFRARVFGNDANESGGPSMQVLELKPEE